MPGNHLKVEEKQYPVACIKQRRHFTPFVISVELLLGVEAEATLKRIASHLAMKLKEPYSWTCEYVKGGVVITFVPVTHLCIRGDRVLASLIILQLPQWEEGAGLYLFRS